MPPPVCIKFYIQPPPPHLLLSFSPMPPSNFPTPHLQVIIAQSLKTQEIPRGLLLVVKKSHLSARAMACTVQLLEHYAYCAITLFY